MIAWRIEVAAEYDVIPEALEKVGEIVDFIAASELELDTAFVVTGDRFTIRIAPPAPDPSDG